MNGEGVDAAGKLGRQRRIDHAVTLDPALPPEGLRHDMNAEMGLAARPMAGMALMLVRFVDHVQAFREESFGQLIRDEVFHAHRRDLRGPVLHGQLAMAPHRGKNAKGGPQRLQPACRDPHNERL
jgi:hypothetical protein